VLHDLDGPRAIAHDLAGPHPSVVGERTHPLCKLVPGGVGGNGDRPDAGPLDRAIRAHGDLGGDPVPE
jgi:hypothetical protein